MAVEEKVAEVQVKAVIVAVSEVTSSLVLDLQHMKKIKIKRNNSLDGNRCAFMKMKIR